MHIDSINEIQVLITISVSLFEQRSSKRIQVPEKSEPINEFLFSFLELEYWMNGKAFPSTDKLEQKMVAENIS